MSLKTAIQSAALAAFAVVSSLEKSIALVKNTGNPTYDPATGTVTSPSSSQTFTAIVTGYDRYEVDDTKVLITDAKIIVPQSRITGTPLTTDTLTIGSTNWDIKDVTPDPADATWTIQARQA